MIRNLFTVAVLVFCGVAQAEYFRLLFDGKSFDGWRLITRKVEEGLGEKVFSITPEGFLHVYRDFPDGYQLDSGENDTHAIMVTEKSFRNYRFQWDYKWGSKKVNNFGKYTAAHYHL